MELGLMTEPQLGMTYETLLGLARWVERAGHAAFARSDHYAFEGFEAPHATDAFATLGGLARDTSTIDLVVLVSPITFRHPAVIAKNATTIDEMSRGRLRLGVGTGWEEKEHRDYGLEFPDWGERFARFEEALEYLHHAFGRRPGPFHGTFYRLEESDVRPLPSGRLPIIVGGQGPRRTPRLAGTFGDEYNLMALPDDELRARIDRARRAAEQAGRDPAGLRISMMGAAVAGSDRAAFEEILAQVAAADPFGRSAERIENRYRQRGLPVGTADEAQTRIAELEALGFGRFYVQHFGPHESDLLDEVFAALRA